MQLSYAAGCSSSYAALFLTLFVNFLFIKTTVGDLHAKVVIWNATGLADGRPAGILGVIHFHQAHGSTKVHVNGSLTLLPIGEHGFHIHTKGDISGGCSSSGGHYNPHHMEHGGPKDRIRHVGDLGNVKTDAQGKVEVMKTDTEIALAGPYSIIGRTLVVHHDRDDLGRGNFKDSKTTGHAGARIGCGIVGLINSSPHYVPNLFCSLLPLFLIAFISCKIGVL